MKSSIVRADRFLQEVSAQQLALNYLNQVLTQLNVQMNIFGHGDSNIIFQRDFRPVSVT